MITHVGACSTHLAPLPFHSLYPPFLLMQKRRYCQTRISLSAGTTSSTKLDGAGGCRQQVAKCASDRLRAKWLINEHANYDASCETNPFTYLWLFPPLQLIVGKWRRRNRSRGSSGICSNGASTGAPHSQLAATTSGENEHRHSQPANLLLNGKLVGRSACELQLATRKQHLRCCTDATVAATIHTSMIIFAL